jgi:hypothetical protein
MQTLKSRFRESPAHVRMKQAVHELLKKLMIRHIMLDEKGQRRADAKLWVVDESLSKWDELFGARTATGYIECLTKYKDQKTWKRAVSKYLVNAEKDRVDFITFVLPSTHYRSLKKQLGALARPSKFKGRVMAWSANTYSKEIGRLHSVLKPEDLSYRDKRRTVQTTLTLLAKPKPKVVSHDFVVVKNVKFDEAG